MITGSVSAAPNAVQSKALGEWKLVAVSRPDRGFVASGGLKTGQKSSNSAVADRKEILELDGAGTH